MADPSARLSGLAVVCDFDGTITMDDTAVAMLNALASSDWVRWEEEFAVGRIGDQEAMRQQLAAITASPSELVEWVLQFARIRPGAREFLEWCAKRGIAVTIASNGVDLWIDPICTAHGLAASEVLAGLAVAADIGIGVSYDHLLDAEYPEERDHKRLAVLKLQAQGYRVVYVGDGAPDYPAAASADFIFARARLRDLCESQGLRYHAFEDFLDIIAEFEAGSVPAS